MPTPVVYRSIDMPFLEEKSESGFKTYANMPFADHRRVGVLRVCIAQGNAKKNVGDVVR